MPGSRLCLAEREEIRAGLERGDSLRQIARLLGRAASTIWREVVRGSNLEGRYVAVGAHRKAQARARRPKTALLDDPQLYRRVQQFLIEWRWSPQATAKALRSEGIQISHETIYQHIYRHRFGDPRTVLCRPRFRRKRRTRTGRYPHVLGDYRPLVDRPGDPNTEAGHLEGDLIIGAGNYTAAVVICERQTRFCLLGALPKGRNSEHVTDVICQLLAQVPPPLRKTLTWDQGRELTRWQRIERRIGTPVFFCAPHAPWQKPLVENTNGLLRRWLPKRTPIPRTQHTLELIAHKLNTMPRHSLQWDTAQNRYDQLRVAMTT